MDEQFTNVCGHLDRENPAVVMAKPAAHCLKKVVTNSPTSTSGRGDADSLLNVSDSAIPVVRTAQLVVASRRVRHTVLRYSSPR